MGEGPKTCPCCGGRAALRNEPADIIPDVHSVTCRGCGLTMYGVSAAHAVRKWNARIYDLASMEASGDSSS